MRPKKHDAPAGGREQKEHDADKPAIVPPAEEPEHEEKEERDADNPDVDSPPA